MTITMTVAVTISISIMLLCSPALATPYAVQGPTAARAEFSAWAEQNKMTAVSEYQRQPDAQLIDQLRELRRKMKFAEFTNQELQPLLEQIADLAYQTDWPPAERHIVSYALLKFYEITHDETRLKQAAAWPATPQTLVLFSPLTQNRYRQLNSSAQPWLAWEHLREFDQLLLNGQEYPLRAGEVITLQPGTYRMALLSNRHQPVHKTLSAAELMDFKPQAEPLSAGDCTKPQWLDRSFVSKVSFKVFYSLDCQREFVNGAWLENDSNLDKHHQLWKGFEKNYVTSKSVNPNWIWGVIGALIGGAAMSL